MQHSVDTGPPRPLNRYSIRSHLWIPKFHSRDCFCRLLTNQPAVPRRLGLTVLTRSTPAANSNLIQLSSRKALNSLACTPGTSSLRAQHSTLLEACRALRHSLQVLPSGMATSRVLFRTYSSHPATNSAATVSCRASGLSAPPPCKASVRCPRSRRGGRSQVTFCPVVRCQPLGDAEGLLEAASKSSGQQLRLKGMEQDEEPDQQPQQSMYSASSIPGNSGLGMDSGVRQRAMAGSGDLPPNPDISSEDYEILPDDLRASRSTTAMDASDAVPNGPLQQPSTWGNMPASDDSGHSSRGFSISAMELASLVSFAFDHDGYMPPLATTTSLVAALNSSVVAGVPGTAEDTAARREAYGVNALPPSHEVTFLELVMEALDDFTVQALLASGVLSLALAVIAPEYSGVGIGMATGGAGGPPSAEWLEGAAILGTVALVVTVSAATGYAKESKFRQLNSLKDDVQVLVIRGGGLPTPLSSRQLLVGDLAIVEAGDILQADGLLVAGGEIRLDQSHLTGESDEVVRSPGGLDAPAVVLSGSKVLDGFGKMLVLAVGPYSQQGSINAMMRQASSGSGADSGGHGPPSTGSAGPISSGAAVALTSTASMDGGHGSVAQRRQKRWRKQRSLEGLSGGAATALKASAAVAGAALATVGSVASYDGVDGSDAVDPHVTTPGTSAGTSSELSTASSSSINTPSNSSSNSDPEGGGMRVETFLTQKLQVLAQRIGAFGVAAAAGVFVVNAVAYTTGLLSGVGGDGIFLSSGNAMNIARSYLDLIITSITILVVAVPEGLPLAVTLALAFSVQRMLADNNLVRQLGACETMGAATTICSDKTGTLTSNDMTVVRLWAAGHQFRVVRGTEETTVNHQYTHYNRHSHSLNLNHDGPNQFHGSFNSLPAAIPSDVASGSNSQSNGPRPSSRQHSSPSSPVGSPRGGGPSARLVPLASKLPPRTTRRSPGADDASGTMSKSTYGSTAMNCPHPTSHHESNAQAGVCVETEREDEATFENDAGLPAAVRSLLIQGLVVNSTASLRRSHHGNASWKGATEEASSSSSSSSSASASTSSAVAAAEGSRSTFQRSGSPTECALLELPYNLGWGWDWGWGPGWGFNGRAGGSAGGSLGSVTSTIDDVEFTKNDVDDGGAFGASAAAPLPPPASASAFHLSGGTCQVLQLLPFSSQRKRMSVVISAPLPPSPQSAVLTDSEDAGIRAMPQRNAAGGNTADVVSLCSGSVEFESRSSVAQVGCSSSYGSGDSSLMPVRVLTKGAAELVLERCAWQLGGPDGTTLLPLTVKQRRKLLSSFAGQDGGSLRLLALAYRDMLVPMRGMGSTMAATAAEAEAPAGSTPEGIVGGAASYGRGEGDAGSPGPPSGSPASLSLDGDFLERDLVLVGLLGLEDPLRLEVPAAVAACNRAGITVRMITGDNVITAASIAQQAGILPPGVDVRALVAAGPEVAKAAVAAAKATASGAAAGKSARDATNANTTATAMTTSSAAGGFGALEESPSSDTVTSVAPSTCSTDVVPLPVDQVPYLVVEGATFRRLVLLDAGASGHGAAAATAAPAIDSAAFMALWPRLRVLARCSPGDKFVLVSALKKLREEGRLEEVVAVTGDGTNDAPALTAADVGFCMNTGTPIAREAADILLLDSSFSSIVSAVAWGRNVYASVTRFLQFQLTANVVAVAVAAGGAVWLRYSPLSAVQMLWVNLIMDSLASLALATEAPNDAMLDAPPNRPNDPLVTPTVLKHIVGQAVFQLTVLFGMLAALEHYSGSDGGSSSHAAASAAATAAAATAAAAAAAAAGGATSGLDTIATLVSGGLAEINTASDNPHLLEMTLVFNAFVQMQLFNQLNCRRVRDEVNVLEGLAAHPLFLVIVASEAVLQFFIVQYGGEAFSTTPLTAAQWALCMGLGATSLLVRGLLRGLKIGSWEPPGPAVGSRGGVGTALPEYKRS